MPSKQKHFQMEYKKKPRPRQHTSEYSDENFRMNQQKSSQQAFKVIKSHQHQDTFYQKQQISSSRHHETSNPQQYPNKNLKYVSGGFNYSIFSNNQESFHHQMYSGGYSHSVKNNQNKGKVANKQQQNQVKQKQKWVQKQKVTQKRKYVEKSKVFPPEGSMNEQINQVDHQKQTQRGQLQTQRQQSKLNGESNSKSNNNTFVFDNKKTDFFKTLKRKNVNFTGQFANSNSNGFKSLQSNVLSHLDPQKSQSYEDHEDSVPISLNETKSNDVSKFLNTPLSQVKAHSQYETQKERKQREAKMRLLRAKNQPAYRKDIGLFQSSNLKKVKLTCGSVQITAQRISLSELRQIQTEQIKNEQFDKLQCLICKQEFLNSQTNSPKRKQYQKASVKPIESENSKYAVKIKCKCKSHKYYHKFCIQKHLKDDPRCPVCRHNFQKERNL